MKKSLIYISALIIGIQTVNAQNNVVNKHPDKVYIGGVMKANSLNKDNYEFVDIPVKPITISFSPLSIHKTMVIEPSYENMMKAVRERVEEKGEIIASMPSFIGSIQELESYDHLDVFFGQNINKLMYFGIPENQKSKKTIAIMNMQNIYLSVDMDFPEDGKLYTNSKDIEGYGENELIYPISVGFGRELIVMVESDYEFSDLKPAIEYMSKKASGDINKDDKMEAIIANSIVRIMCMGKNFEKIDPSNPLREAMEYMNSAVNAEDFGIPLVFSPADLINNNALYQNEY